MILPILFFNSWCYAFYFDVYTWHFVFIVLKARNKYHVIKTWWWLHCQRSQLQKCRHTFCVLVSSHKVKFLRMYQLDRTAFSFICLHCRIHSEGKVIFLMPASHGRQNNIIHTLNLHALVQNILFVCICHKTNYMVWLLFNVEGKRIPPTEWVTIIYMGKMLATGQCCALFH